LFAEHFSGKISSLAVEAGLLMLRAQSIGSAVVLSTVLMAGGAARGQENQHENLAPCPGSAPEPTQSAAWPVSFCNRTGHDIVIEFHDNDCPVRNGDRRGDIYQKTLRRGESKTLPLCYANEPQQAKNPPPGVPMLRLPGGKGVVTTWSVVGDCGDRSKSLNLDARTFYDRGDYKTGIILLQYPAGASHCVAEAPATAGGPAAPGAAQAQVSGSGQPRAQSQPATQGDSPAQAQSHLQPQPAIAPHSPVTASPAATPDPAPTVPAIVNSRPSLTAAIDTKDPVARTVGVFANGTGAPGYTCKFTLELTFTDGASWNDFVQANVMGTEGSTPVSTRKYLKSVSRVGLTSTKCTPL
jgi:hypothetical protein